MENNRHANKSTQHPLLNNRDDEHQSLFAILNEFDPILNNQTNCHQSSSIDITEFDPIQLPSLKAESAQDDLESLNFQRVIMTDKSGLRSYALLGKVLQIVRQPDSNLHIESQDLAKYADEIKVSIQSESLFFTPSVAYCTTKYEFVKLVVYEDKT
jgi:hypothetical protein